MKLRTQELQQQLKNLSAHRVSRRGFLAAGASLAGLGLLAACGDDDDDPADDDEEFVDEPDDEDDEPAEEPDDGDDEDDEPAEEPDDEDDRYGGRVVIAVKDTIESMDNHVASAPSSGYVYDNMYDQLVVIHPDGETEPSLATSWEVYEDEPTRWRVELRDDVDWHNGDHFTAEDLSYHFDRVFDPDDPGRPAGLLAAYSDNEVVDDYTIEFITDHPFPTFINDLVPRWQSISTNPRHTEEVGVEELGNNPVGTGPFKFKEWVVGQRIVFEAFDDYWGGRPYLDEIEFREIPEDSARLSALRAGEVDYIYVVPAHEVEALENDDNFNLLTTPSWVSSWITINAGHAPFNDLNVRQAVGYAVNNQEIVDIAWEGLAEPSNSLIPPGVAGHDPNRDAVWPYDPDEARSLLEEAGWVSTNGNGIREKDGEELSFEFHYTEGARWPSGVSEVIQSNLADVGMEARLQRREGAALISEEPEGIIPISGGGTGMGTGNFAFVSWEHFNRDGGRSYHFLWESDDPEAQAEFDALTAEAASEFDDERRAELWGDVTELNRQYALKIPLYFGLLTGATRAGVQGAYMHGGEYIRMHEVWIED